MLMCNIMSAVLSNEPELYVVGKAAANDEKMMERLVYSQCDIVLLASSLPEENDLQLVRTITQRAPKSKLIVVGVPRCTTTIISYVAAGASGYVLQELSVDSLLANIYAVKANTALVSPDVAAALMQQIAQLAQATFEESIDPTLFESLTSREQEVLALLAESLSNQGISQRLHIEVGTVKNHVHNILKKLEVKGRDEAASFFNQLQQSRT